MSDIETPITTLNVASQEETKQLGTEALRERFMVPTAFKEGKITLTYTDADRAILGGAAPTQTPLKLHVSQQLRTQYLCERRELGIINIGESGSVEVDGTTYELENLECLYVGRGAKNISFASAPGKSAKFYLISYPAHMAYPTTKAGLSDARALELGSSDACNERTIYQYVHEEGIKSCQLMLGVTLIKPGSVWNTMPAHTHDRRSEIYLYFNLDEAHTVFHFMGDPQNTRHLCVHNHDAVISPAWSIHSGAGTSHYGFIWAMGGENQRFDDMDLIEINTLK